MRQKLNMLFTLICLLSTSIITIATSKKDDSPASHNQAPVETLARRNYYVASNCPQSVQQEQITVTNEHIEYPPSINFSHFGLPAERLNLTMSFQISNIMQGRQRDCTRTEMNDQGVPLIVYTCTEGGAFLCQVSFEQTQ